jgi:hypothetical protein
MVVAVFCGIGFLVCTLNAMSHRKPGIGRTHPMLWRELTPDGVAWRNAAWAFFGGAVGCFIASEFFLR